MKQSSQLFILAGLATILMMVAVVAGCSDVINTSPATAPPQNKDVLRTVFICTVLEDPKMTTEGAPHRTEGEGSGVPYADVGLIKSKVSIDITYMGAPREEAFFLLCLQEMPYTFIKGNRYLVLMTEESPVYAYINYDFVYVINKDDKIELLGSNDTTPSINGKTVMAALEALGIPAK